MSFLVHLLVFILVAGLIYYVITLLPIPQPFKNVALAILCLILVIILLGDIGLLGDWDWPRRVR